MNFIKFFYFKFSSVIQEKTANCVTVKAPSTDYEKKRRRIRFTVENLWYMVKHKIGNFLENDATDFKPLSDLITSLYEMKL